MELKNVFAKRVSVRAYKETQISDEQLQAILDAAYQAPVAMGQYENSTLIVMQDADALKQLNTICSEKAGKPGMAPSYGAPTVIFVCQKADMEDILMGANAGTIMQNMLLAATEQGLGSCFLFGMTQMTYTDETVKQIIGVPEGFRTVSAIAVGYPQEETAERAIDRDKIRTLR